MYKILIVDDDANNRFSISALFEQGDFQLFLASDGNEALKLLMDTTIDLIILDVQLPDYNGFQLAKIIKSRKSTKNIPIILATAVFKAQVFMEEGLEAGAVDYIIKPINGQILLSKVNYYRQSLEQFNQVKETASYYKTLFEQLCASIPVMVRVYSEEMEYSNETEAFAKWKSYVTEEAIDEIIQETIVKGQSHSRTFNIGEEVGHIQVKTIITSINEATKIMLVAYHILSEE